MKVLLDTNFLIDIIRFKIDLEGLYDLTSASDLLTLSSVEKELKKISKKTSRAGMCARIALELIKQNDIKILKSEGIPDDAMVKLASEKTLVATNDVKLRKILKTSGRKTIYLKAKKHLAIG